MPEIIIDMLKVDKDAVGVWGEEDLPNLNPEYLWVIPCDWAKGKDWTKGKHESNND